MGIITDFVKFKVSSAMIRMSLSTEEKANLNQLRLIKKSNIGERAYYVLLSDEGKSVKEISKQLSRNAHTIRLWLSRYIDKGIIGLQGQAKTGRPAKKAPVIESQLIELLGNSPQTYGYQEAGWQINILRDLFKKQGLLACENTIVKALNKLGFVYKRFSKTLPANAPSAQEKKMRIDEIVETISQVPVREREVLFVDETHFSNQPYVARGWFKCGEKK